LRIYLIGYMGAGKSTAAKKLASRLRYDFIDLDQEFEKEFNIDIPLFFIKFGETEFRKREKEILQNISKSDSIIVATGGGTPCFHNNMDFMNANGTTIYLKLHPHSLYLRLTDSKTIRPLLADIAKDKQEEFIERHLKEREDYYLKSKLIIKGEGISINKMIALLNVNPKPESNY